MIFISSQSQTPSGYIRGFEFVPLSHPLATIHSRRSRDCIQSVQPRHTMGRLTVHQKGRSKAPVFNKIRRATSEAAQIKLRRSVITTIRFRWLPLISFHKLIFIFSIPPHGSGAFPGASVVSSLQLVAPPVRAPGKRTVMVLLSFRWASGHPNGWSAW